MSRSVVISGGGTGIGRSIARSFVENGNEVVIIGRRAAVLNTAATELGDRVRPVVCDLADPVAVQRALIELPARIDVLVNAAGANLATRTPRPDSLAEVVALWEGQVRANLLTTVALTCAVLDRLGPGGRIVGFSSGAARSGGPHSYGYGVAKAAVEAWARGLSAEVGSRGITVNAVAPGLTDGTEFFPADVDDETRARLVARADNRRAGTTGDVAAAVLFLTSPDAGHISGQTLAVDGGVALSR
ncbi:SDR family NAD(P)-dependent oxidoreductase [Pseudofrankia inefficax]|uniref:Short-chain dehydrogenase/reductase SDR n=1 Tax=Pseudofrankia inefficax (strain DSM 45817 / CECT 9037 / DDB 130130 / EuI1c) TaxID=298654 RepID=E3IV96_PSEI1|nr:SDR family oxidoreductase [Pseudofrankia inefficax]ADP81260.1 short-chain dehydrogenase/reductase SDR [Pseudofrankia inefficax]